MIGPCDPYASAEQLIAAGICDLPDDDTDQATELVTESSQILFTLLGGQFPGRCERTFRPRSRGCGAALFLNPLGLKMPYYQGGYNWPWGYLNEDTEGGRLPVFYGATADDIAVMIDGDEFYDFVVMDGRWLLRTDGKCCWPCCQNMHLPDTEPDTFSVTMTFGPATPTLLRSACIELAAELWRVTANRNDPLDRATSISREGVSIQQQADQVIEAGPALPKCHMAMQTWNKNGGTTQSVFLSPDDAWVMHQIDFPTIPS